MVACVQTLVGGCLRKASGQGFVRLVLAAAVALLPVQAATAQGDSGARSGGTGAASPPRSPLLAERAPLVLPPSSIVVMIRRSYVFGSGRDRFCSPEVAVFNQGIRGVGLLMVAMEFYQFRNGVSQKVGSAHPRFVVDPGESVIVGFQRLSTDTCEGVYARATTSVCLLRDRSSCEDRVVFSDSGQLPIFDAGVTQR